MPKCLDPMPPRRFEQLICTPFRAITRIQVRLMIEAGFMPIEEMADRWKVSVKEIRLKAELEDT